MGYREGWARIHVPATDGRVLREVDLSPAMQQALAGAVAESGTRRLHCEVLIGTRVALIDRGLLLPGAERHLTPAGEDAHRQLTEQRS